MPKPDDSMKPGDEAHEGTTGTGDDVCPNPAGTGVITRVIGGA